jgi:uncharacterized protein (DUF342 family)
MDSASQVPASFRDRALGFSLTLRASHLELTVFPPTKDARPLSADAVIEAAADFPVEPAADRILMAVRQHTAVAVTVGEVRLEDTLSDWEIQVSSNRLVAYLVPRAALREPAPPPVEIEVDALRKAVDSAGVTYGLLDDAFARFAPSDAPTHVIEVARGSRPVPGTDARIEFTFHDKEALAPIMREDGSVDHHAAASRSVETGTVLAVRHPLKPGIAGTDVLGHPIPIPPPVDIPLAAVAGAGTRIDGDTLVADRAGGPVFNGGKVDVLLVYEVKGDVDYSVGNIQFSGDVIIGGDINPGFSVHAEGSVTVRGVVDRATIEAGHDLVARGIVGDGRGLITAGGNMTVAYAHQANIAVGATLTVNREMVGCTVFADKVLTSPSGRIVGGDITARDEISTSVLGSAQEVPTLVTILRSAEHQEPVIRATRAIYAGTTITLGKGILRVTDDLAGSSFWEVDGEISRLSSAATSPKAA